MDVDALVKAKQIIPVGYLSKVYDSVFVDANFMQPDEDHIVLFFFDERHSIVSEAREAEDPRDVLDTFAFNMREDLSEYGAESVRAYLLLPNEKRKKVSVMLSVVFICASEADYIVSSEGKRRVLSGVYRTFSFDVESKFKRRGGVVSLRRCISISNHILGPDGYSLDILSMRPETNPYGVPVQVKRGKTISRNYSSMVRMNFFSDGYTMEDTVEVITDSVPKLGKNADESLINGYKSAVSDTIRGAFSRFSFIVYGNVRYLCKTRIIERIVGKSFRAPREDIGIEDLLLVEDDSDADSVEEDLEGADVDIEDDIIN